jgi:hypothetical protein
VIYFCCKVAIFRPKNITTALPIGKMCFSREVETLLRDTDIQERQAQQRRRLSWGWLYYLQFQSVLNKWFIGLCTTTWSIWYHLWINMALWRTDRRWRTCWSTLVLCFIQLKRMAGGFRLHGLFEGVWPSTPSTVTGGDVCWYLTCWMLLAKILFDREHMKKIHHKIDFYDFGFSRIWPILA